MQPVIVILGRPNVGKSTLFNRLAQRRIALVHDTPGVTRDRKEVTARIAGRDVSLVDTAGLEEAPPDTVPGRMRASSEAALRGASLVLFVMDARAGITPADRAFAAWLRRMRVPVLVVANKAEGRAGTTAAMEAFELGLGDPVPVSSEHGDGFGNLHDEIAAKLGPLPEDEADAEDTERPLRLAIVGRPNAGKSTLLNALLGEDRMITGPEPGLTRDAVAVQWRDATGGEVRLVDTAGMRKKARVQETLEQMSVASSLAALKEAEVVVLVLDALLGMDEQDLRIARLAEREGRALVIALNKWDAVEDRNVARKRVEDALMTSLAQSKGVPVVRAAYALWNRRIPTGEVNRWFEAALARHQPPLVDGKRIKLRYATMPKARPPTMVIFGTRADMLPEDYRRYLVNSFREHFTMPGVPIRLQLRSPRNPYAEDDG
jgi:GTP-binding protein